MQYVLELSTALYNESSIYYGILPFLFQRLMSKLLTDMPEDPLNYLFERLKQENDDCK